MSYFRMEMEFSIFELMCICRHQMHFKFRPRKINEKGLCIVCSAMQYGNIANKRKVYMVKEDVLIKM